MFHRLGARTQRILLLILVYMFMSLLLTYTTVPYYSSVFISEDLSVGLKYSLIYLNAGAPIMADHEGADVFARRGCGECFLTNNPGFMPLSEYDAVLTLGLEKKTLKINRGRLFVLKTSEVCLKRKLKGCDSEPIVSTLSNSESWTLCELCEMLQNLRKRDKSLCSFPQTKQTEDMNEKENSVSQYYSEE